jgi:hypothetical protein
MAKQPKQDRPQRSSKVRPVSIAEMRVPPAGITQRKFNKAQAEGYAANMDLDKLGIPIVNLRGGIYWILDGQHRIEALKMFFAPSDPGQIQCEVYEDLTDAEMADIFLGRDDRRAINFFEKFQVACTAGRSRESDIRRTIEAQGLKVSQTKEPGCVGAIGSCGKVYDIGGANVLGQALRVISHAFGADPKAFEGHLIQGLGLVFNRYNGKTNERRLVQQLTTYQHGARGVLQRAEAQRERTGNSKSHCVAATLVDIYNKGAGPRASDRLPSWWKTDATRS